MKKLIVATLLTGLYGVAGMAHADPAVNPFSGKYTEIEQAKTETELAKAQNALSDEKLKQAKANFMLKNAPKLFAVELRKQMADSGGATSGPTSFGPSRNLDYPSGPLPGMSSKKHTKTDKKAQADVAPTSVAPVMQTYVPAGPKLIGVIEQGKVMVAMIDTGGVTVNAKVGDTVSGLGVVRSISASDVVGTERSLAANQAPITVANVDAQVVGKAAMGGTSGRPPAIVLPPSTSPIPSSFGGAKFPPPVM